ncbi:MAG: dihydropyrimidinase, partial [Alphaproteobacteria bacterium]|nr:dihydropyrimidinase [Alphaproteobacteria bacterium]
MSKFDLLLRNGTVATAADTFQADVAIKDGRVVALGNDLGTAEQEIDASGKLLLPGGVEGHCHIEQISSSGIMTADDFYSGTVSAVFGGTTTVIPFAAQQKGDSLRQTVEAYHECAGPK